MRTTIVQKLIKPITEPWPEGEQRRVAVPCELYVSAGSAAELSALMDEFFGIDECNVITEDKAHMILYPEWIHHVATVVYVENDESKDGASA